MAERVGNPVPREIRDQLDRGEQPLVYELVTRPKDPGDAAPTTWAGRLAAAIGGDDQHELLLTKQRLAVVTTTRRGRQPRIAVSVPRHELVSVAAAGSGLERGRVRFEFRDGSATSGVMGLVLPRPAQRFLAAYEASTPKPRRPGRRA